VTYSFDENSRYIQNLWYIYIRDVDSFEFEEIGSLATNKFQLFNEYGFNFYSSKYHNK
jgi:hypothetical protein